jgi:putative ABC transport system permease protein
LNSFLIKARKKEFGLKRILGLEKRHVCRVIFIENNSFLICPIICGLVCGTVFGKLIFMVLLMLLNVAPGSRFDLSFYAYMITVGYFCIVFVLSTFYNQLQVRLSNPIDLINGSKKGEKKVRCVLLKTILGFVCVGIAYFGAIRASDITFALLFFWPAVILVIIGTNLLFTGGSQFVLQGIKNNPRAYYKPRNFISVSGLMYRMKQHASGLANICILSTMVLVTVSFVFSLYFGQEKILDAQNPVDYSLRLSYEGNPKKIDLTDAYAELESYAAQHEITIDQMYTFEGYQDRIIICNGEMYFKNSDSSFDINYVQDYAESYRLYIISQDEFNRLTGEAVALGENEIIILSSQTINMQNDLDINGRIYHIKKISSDTMLTDCKNAPRINAVFMVARDAAACSALHDAVNPGIADDNTYADAYLVAVTEINFTADDSDVRTSFAAKINDTLYPALTSQITPTSLTNSSIDTNRSEGYGLYGGLMFIGLFFVILFIINTVLIMYFKQISEGYEDRARYEIMRNVGLSDEEVRATINRQVLIVFFLPLIAALAHILAASNIITQILNGFIMTDNTLTLICISVTSAVYSLVYILIFRFTAKTYYKIVK